jgi:DnaJ-class molecular chaperone
MRSVREYLVLELGRIVVPPTPEERKQYREFLRNGGRVELDMNETTIDLAILGLVWPFSFDELKTAWKKIALVHHPDRGGKHEDFLRAKESYDAAKRFFGAY